MGAKQSTSKQPKGDQGTSAPDQAVGSTNGAFSTGEDSVLRNRKGSIDPAVMNPDVDGTSSLNPWVTVTTAFPVTEEAVADVKPEDTQTSVKPGNTEIRPMRPGSSETSQVVLDSTETNPFGPSNNEVKPVRPSNSGIRPIRPENNEIGPVRPENNETGPMRSENIDIEPVGSENSEIQPMRPHINEIVPVRPEINEIGPVRPEHNRTNFEYTKTTPANAQSCETFTKSGIPQITGMKTDKSGTTPVRPDSPGNPPVRSDSPGTPPVRPDSPGTTPVRPNSPRSPPVSPDSPGTTPVSPDSPGTTPVKPDSPGTTRLVTKGSLLVEAGPVSKDITPEETRICLTFDDFFEEKVKKETHAATCIKSKNTYLRDDSMSTLPHLVHTKQQLDSIGQVFERGEVGITVSESSSSNSGDESLACSNEEAVINLGRQDKSNSSEEARCQDNRKSSDGTRCQDRSNSSVETRCQYNSKLSEEAKCQDKTNSSEETLCRDKTISSEETICQSSSKSGEETRCQDNSNSSEETRKKYKPEEERIFNFFEKNESTLNTDALKPRKTLVSSEVSSCCSSDEECSENSNEEKATQRTEVALDERLSGEEKVQQRMVNLSAQVLSASDASIAHGISDAQLQEKSSTAESSGTTRLLNKSQSGLHGLTDRHVPTAGVESKSPNKPVIKTTSAGQNPKEKQNSIKKKKRSQAKTTVVFAKLSNFNLYDDVCSYIRYRFPHPGIIGMEPSIEHETRSTIVAIHCQSKRVAEQVIEDLHKGNRKSKTIIWCFDRMEEARGQQVRLPHEIQHIFNYHLKQMTSRAEKVLICHDDKICGVKKELEQIAVKKRKHMSLPEFAECQKSVCALEDKIKELQLQRVEFEKCLEEFSKDLDFAKDSCKFESKAKNIRRNAYVECSRLTSAFPIYAQRSNIIETVQKNQVSVIIGETGSGKSTQLAQYFYQSGLADTGIIACTQPRKIAATSLATHVAKELGMSVGQVVGYKVGMQVKKTNLTKVLYMTDHILLNECLEDKKLSNYSCIIIDEAHERSIYTDLLLGMIKDCLKDRPELRVIITSATINPKLFVEYFSECPVLHISGRMFPVDVEWQEAGNGEDAFDKYVEKAAQKAIEIHQTQGEGDILVFVTKPIETERCCALFEDMMRGRPLNYETLPLHGRLQRDEQQRVFNLPPPGKRKIVFATNIAETSVTIQGIKFVIDTGLVNEMKYDAVRKISTLAVTMVSQSSANQRKGRAGRLGPGKCYRLYSENDFKKMTTDSLPEILKVHISHAILKLMELGVNPMEFDFVESPSSVAMKEAFNSLIHIGAVADNKITDLGKWIIKMPFDPQYGAFVHEAVKVGLGLEAIVVAAASGTGSVFFRGGSSQEKELADKHKITFCHEQGDQMTTLTVFREWYHVPEREKNRWCVAHSINAKSVRGIREITSEVIHTLKKELMVDLKFIFAKKEEVNGMLASLLFRALHNNLSHYLGHMKAGFWIVSKDQRVEIHPSSSLLALGNQPEWIVFDQVLRTTKTFAMQITPVPENLVKRGIEDGWLTLDIEETRRKEITVVSQENVGSQLFREVVGPRYVDLQSFEAELAATCPDSVVVVEADQDKGELRVLTSEVNKSHLENSFFKVVPPLRAKYKSEESEEHIGSATDYSERAVLGAGGSTVDILLPGEYKAIIIVCPLDKIEDMSEKQVEEQFRRYGNVKQCIRFFRKNKNSQVWGKVVYEQRQAAITAVEATREDSGLSARPNTRAAGSSAVGFNAKIQWCRRPSRGFGFVDFTEVEDFMRAMQLHVVVIGGRRARIKGARNSPQSIHVSELDNFVTEDVLREAFATRLDIDPVSKIQKVLVAREKVNLDKEILAICKTDLLRKLEKFSLPRNFCLDVREPRSDRDINFMAYCFFKNPDEGYEACTSINNGFMLSGQGVTMKANINSSVLIHREVYKKKKTELESQLKDIENEQIRIKCEELKNGNFSVQLNAESADALAHASSSIQKVIGGEKIECENKPELITLFSYEGRKMIQEIMNRTHALILLDNRVMRISIHGLQRECQDAQAQIEKYTQEIKQGKYSNVDLIGGGKPPGVMKALILKYKVDLSGLQREVGLATLKLDLRRHRLWLCGSEKAITEATDLIKQIICSLTLDGSVPQNDDNPDCVTCFCPVEPKDLYRLELCGHAYCKECIQLQVDTAISNKDFPIKCGDEDCSERIVWRDFINLSRFGYLTIARLVSASVGSYVSEHRNEVRFCTTPDCPAVYRVSQRGSLFTCPECATRICTSCHVQYHDGMSCEMFRHYGSDGSLLEWMRQDRANRKICPSCGSHIEKIGGCNKVKCLSCRKSICWVCMSIFDEEADCYGHMRTAHRSFV